MPIVVDKQERGFDRVGGHGKGISFEANQANLPGQSGIDGSAPKDGAIPTAHHDPSQNIYITPRR
ncbi:hypothetical protein JCM17478_29690 [Thermopirellula anaerolimosa]